MLPLSVICSQFNADPVKKSRSRASLLPFEAKWTNTAPGAYQCYSLMSDSDEDRPLAARATTAKISSGLGANGSSAAAQRTGQPSTSAAQDPLKRRAAQKAPVIDESDSEDDQPLAARTKPANPAARPGVVFCLFMVVHEPNYATKALTLCTQDPGGLSKKQSVLQQ